MYFAFFQAELRDQLKESQNQHQLLNQAITDCDKQCEDQKLTIESMNKECNRLNKENTVSFNIC